tara:strand:+ start:520 stop:660 length:141 start_codon:yes stop_codon:yes gene_type:complete
MLEAIKHLLGFCGEPHGLAYYIIFGGTFVSAIITYIKLIFKEYSNE